MHNSRFYGSKITIYSSLFVILLTPFVMSSCAPRKVVQKEAETAPQVERKPEAAQPEAEKIKAPGPEVITEKPVTEEVQVAKKEEKAIAKKTEFPDIYFDFDKYDIRPDAKPVLEKLASWLKSNPKAKVLIEGHCDERGTNQYNLALGERRANAAKNYLMALGISSSRIETVTYGEERPLCREQTEECWQLNRRAHFVIYE
ncbi:MAG: peptidoglycan-associated lipoprotein Pal [Thermodesulfovibrionales bacterium]|nr:peptidoglycan-associated lipoprotein Pal [Thermodesulfovibrionales bacterium]